MQKWPIIICALLVVGCEEKASAPPTDIDLDNPATQQPEAPTVTPPAAQLAPAGAPSAETAALLAQIATLEEKIKNAGASASASASESASESAALKAQIEELKKKLAEAKAISTGTGGVVTAGTGLVRKKTQASIAEFVALSPAVVGTTLLTEGADGKVQVAGALLDVSAQPSTCFMLCPPGRTPFQRTRKIQEFIESKQDVVEVEVEIGIPVWHCGQISGDQIAHQDSVDSPLTCGGKVLALQPQTTNASADAQVEPFAFDPVVEANKAIAAQMAFFEPGGDAEFETAGCPTNQGITGVIAGAIFGYQTTTYTNLGMAYLLCGSAKTVQPPQGNSFFGIPTGGAAVHFGNPPEKILGCGADRDLVGWAQFTKPTDVGSDTTTMALCRAKKKS